MQNVDLGFYQIIRSKNNQVAFIVYFVDYYGLLLKFYMLTINFGKIKQSASAKAVSITSFK